MESLYSVLAQAQNAAKETLKVAVDNAKEDVAITKDDTSIASPLPASPEGRFVAYGSLVVLAMIPIMVGSFMSVKYNKKQLNNLKKTGEEPERMTKKDALMFPVIASCALCGIYIFFKVFSKEYLNMVISGYFFFMGVAAMSQVIAPILRRLSDRSQIANYDLKFVQSMPSEKDEPTKTYLIDFAFDKLDIYGTLAAVMFGGWYVYNKHWIANNLFALAFSINAIKFLHLNSVATGCILLGGLFFYDILWVFGTDVMITVAKSFDAPIKIIFPQDFLVNGVFGTKFAMLGLGDIVIPGIYIALLLRFDKSLGRNSHLYFNTCMFAYLLGLLITMIVMTIFKHAQPALLYLVPSCILLPFLIAVIKGDLKALFAYRDLPEPVEQAIQDNKSKKSN